MFSIIDIPVKMRVAMRLVSFLKEGRWCPGFRRGDSVVEVADSDLASAQAVIAAVMQGRRPTEGPSHPVAGITLGLPVPEPEKIICIGLTTSITPRKATIRFRIIPRCSRARKVRWWRMASL
jgi:hypothetical protein